MAGRPGRENFSFFARLPDRGQRERTGQFSETTGQSQSQRPTRAEKSLCQPGGSVHKPEKDDRADESGRLLRHEPDTFHAEAETGFDLSAGLYNLFDKRYADSGGVEHVQTSIPQDGRSFRVKLTYRPRLRAR